MSLYVEVESATIAALREAARTAITSVVPKGYELYIELMREADHRECALAARQAAGSACPS